MEFRYFNEKTDPLIKGLSEDLLIRLDSARDAAQVPFRITSGLRTPGENSVLKGAVADSSHLVGLAVDLHVEDDFALQKMLYGLFIAGFKRIGLYLVNDPTTPTRLLPRHIHVDIDQTKPQYCFFLKKEQN